MCVCVCVQGGVRFPWIVVLGCLWRCCDAFLPCSTGLTLLERNSWTRPQSITRVSEYIIWDLVKIAGNQGNHCKFLSSSVQSSRRTPSTACSVVKVYWRLVGSMFLYRAQSFFQARDPPKRRPYQREPPYGPCFTRLARLACAPFLLRNGCWQSRSVRHDLSYPSTL